MESPYIVGKRVIHRPDTNAPVEAFVLDRDARLIDVIRWAVHNGIRVFALAEQDPPEFLGVRHGA